MALHPELQKFFDTHAAKTCDCKRAAHDQLGPILTLCQEIRTHIHDLEARLEQAELAAHDHALDGKFEWMHTRLNAGKVRCENFRREARDLAKVLVEIEESFNQDVIDMNTMLAIRGSGGTIATATPVAVTPSVP